MKAAFEQRTRRASASSTQSKELVVEAVSVEAVGGGAKFARAGAARRRARRSPRRRGARASSPAAHGTTRTVYTRDQLAPGHKVHGPRHHHRAASDRRGRGRLAGRAHREEPSRARRASCRSSAARDRHQGRSGDARSVQQPVHVDRRADGRGAAEHRLLGQHQGAARFLLRGVRRRRHAGRQRAAHAGASRLDGPRGRDHHPRERRAGSRRATSTPSTRPTTAARTCPTSPCARRCSTTREQRRSCSGSPRAAITPMSAASRPARCRRNATTIEEEGVYIDNFKLVDRGRFREKELYDAAHRREISGAQSAAERQRPQGADRRQREGRAGAAQDGGAFHAAGGARPT